ncbi:shikimate dehydrogenase [Jatrophihabitans fulvus]
MSRRAAVLGRPIAHSLSPLLHRRAYRELGLDWTYEALECGEDELPGLLDARRDWAGFSCTMPLKHAALALASEVRSSAAAADAANTLLPDGRGGWIADNTDVDGVLGALAAVDVRPASVTVLGAGGTAQAVVVALGRLGLGEAAVLVRDTGRAAALRVTAERAGVTLDVRTFGADGPLASDLVVSTLPPGAADAVAGHAWRPGQAVLDAVYAGWPTRLAAAADAAGATVIGGASLLLHQAVRQVELMTGRPGPLAAMRDELADAVPGALLA